MEDAVAQPRVVVIGAGIVGCAVAITTTEVATVDVFPAISLNVAVTV